MTKIITRFFRPLLKRLRLFQSNLNLSKILRLVWSVAPRWTAYNVLMILIETGSFFFSLYALKLLIDSVSASMQDLMANKDTILLNLFLAGFSAILYAVSKAISNYVTEKQSAIVAEYMDDKIHENAIRLDLSFYETPEYFDILKRAKDAGADRPALVIKTLSEIVKNTLTLLALAAALVVIDWWLLPMLCVLLFPMLLVKLTFADKLNMWRIRQTPLERRANYLGSLITSETAAKELRSYDLGNHFKSHYLKIRLQLLSERLNISKRRTKNDIVVTALATIGFFFCIGYIALKSLSGGTTVGDIALFLVAFPQSFSILQNLFSGISVVYQNNIYINSIFDLFALKSKLVKTDNALEITSPSPLCLEMKDVCFTYPHCNKPVLNNINLKIPVGKIVGLVGVNGSGKSTLVKLLNRLYDVEKGEICLGETDIRRLKPEDYRRQIGMVFQDFMKYNFSIKENIRLGALDVRPDEARIVEAAKKAGVHDFICQLPDGYDSMMGRLFADGNEASIGQWQKIAMARAFYSHAPLLIFDEATSALDAMAEKALFDSFRQSIGTRSALVISHRHSAIKHADYIYVLQEGSIIESGTDNELLAAGGVYASLFKKEAADRDRVSATGGFRKRFIQADVYEQR